MDSLRRSGTLILLLVATLLAACNTGSTAPAADLDVTDVTANLTLPTTTGAVYLTITNGTSADETLLGAAIPGCDAVELHEMRMDGDVMRMNEVEGGVVLIPAGETVMLEQGGLHIMCVGKTGSYEVGDTITVTLRFENAGEIDVEAQIIAPGESGMNMDG